MSRFEVRLLPLGEDAGEEATVSHFFPEVGDEIGKDEDLVELITEKATVTLPSPVAGRVVSIEAGEDDMVRVGDVLAVIEVPD